MPRHPLGGALRVREAPLRAAFHAGMTRLWLSAFSVEIENVGSDACRGPLTSGKPLSVSAPSCPRRSPPIKPSWPPRRPGTRRAGSALIGRSGTFSSGWRRLRLGWQKGKAPHSHLHVTNQLPCIGLQVLLHPASHRPLQLPTAIQGRRRHGKSTSGTSLRSMQDSPGLRSVSR